MGQYIYSIPQNYIITFSTVESVFNIAKFKLQFMKIIYKCSIKKDKKKKKYWIMLFNTTFEIIFRLYDDVVMMTGTWLPA
jgi:hypothetical protein